MDNKKTTKKIIKNKKNKKNNKSKTIKRNIIIVDTFS